MNPIIFPRDYQDIGIQSLWDYFAAKIGNPLVLMPTGTGKSIVIGGFCRSVLEKHPRTRVMAVTHVETLIAQNLEKLLHLWPSAPAGIYSAGLGRRDTLPPIIFAGIQSVCDKAELFGYVDLLIVDEAHLIGPKDETMYQTFIAALMKVNPKLKVIGLTATGWRLGSGELVGDGIFTDVAIDMTTPAAWNWFIDSGYLSPLYGKRTKFHMDADGVDIRGGEYVLSKLQEHVDHDSATRQAVEEMVQRGQDQKCWMVFASGVNHCDHIADMLNDYGIHTVSIHSKSKNAPELIEQYKRGKFRAAVSMNKLTTGVDAPQIDLIGVMRHTMSSSLWVQMLGRGTRPCYAPGYPVATVEQRLRAIAAGVKPKGCMVLDFARNTENLGPVNDPLVPQRKGKRKNGGGGAPIRVCSACDGYCPASARFCWQCGFEFPFKVHMTGEASDLEVMTRVPHEQPAPVVEELTVSNVTYHVHHKQGKPDSLKVSYFVDNGFRMFKEFVLFEYDGPAKRRAGLWWQDRAGDAAVPATTAAAIAAAASLRIPQKIRVWTNRKPYPEIMSYVY